MLTVIAANAMPLALALLIGVATARWVRRGR